MYCPNCGKLNEEGDQYCVFCGAPLIDNQTFDQSASPTPQQILALAKGAGRKGLALVQRHKTAVIGTVAAVVVVAVAGSALSARFSARGVAERYFKAMLNGDANAAYECLDIVASPYTALDEFSDFWEDRYTPVDLYNYSVQSADSRTQGDAFFFADSGDSGSRAARQADSIEKTFNFNYYLRGSDQRYSATVTVVEGTGEIPFIKGYKVMPDFQVTGFTITAPAGSTVTLDSHALAEPESEGGMDVYRVPAIFNDAHVLSVETALGEPRTEVIVPSAEGVQIQDILYSADTRTAVYNQAVSQMSSIMASVLAYGEMPQDIALTPGSTAAQTYYQLRNDLVQPAEGTGLFQFSFTGSQDQSYTDQTFSSEETTYTCSVDFDYIYGNIYRNWNDELVTQDGNGGSSGEFTYVYEDGQWLLDSFWLGIYP